MRLVTPAVSLRWSFVRRSGGRHFDLDHDDFVNFVCRRVRTGAAGCA
jgi:hypothetical protein